MSIFLLQNIGFSDNIGDSFFSIFILCVQCRYSVGFRKTKTTLIKSYDQYILIFRFLSIFFCYFSFSFSVTVPRKKHRTEYSSRQKKTRKIMEKRPIFPLQIDTTLYAEKLRY